MTTIFTRLGSFFHTDHIRFLLTYKEVNMETFLWPHRIHTVAPRHGASKVSRPRPERPITNPARGVRVPAKSRSGVPVTTTQFTATQLITTHAGHSSPQQTHLPGPSPGPSTHTHTVILTSLVWKNTRYSMHSWNGEFSAFSWGDVQPKTKMRQGSRENAFV